MVNKVILIGNLGQDPELRSTPSGQTVCKLSIATTERRKVGDEWKDHTEWHKVVVWGTTADNVGKFCRKGKQIYVEGRLQTRKWTDREGHDRYTTEVIADVVRFLGSKDEGQRFEQRAANPPQESQPAYPPDDDIPF